mmetsp:Transcript_58754/g.117540  ORF Transcript_58754/g.117540 Transcript_58754/m.117540 type:complete len:212 (-) Transcript_58754:86-721(-)
MGQVAVCGADGCQVPQEGCAIGAAPGMQPACGAACASTLQDPLPCSATTDERGLPTDRPAAILWHLLPEPAADRARRRSACRLQPPEEPAPQIARVPGPPEVGPAAEATCTAEAAALQPGRPPVEAAGFGGSLEAGPTLLNRVGVDGLSLARSAPGAASGPRPRRYGAADGAPVCDSDSEEAVKWEPLPSQSSNTKPKSCRVRWWDGFRAS